MILTSLEALAQLRQADLGRGEEERSLWAVSLSVEVPYSNQRNEHGSCRFGHVYNILL
jgi:hypothetical protein